MTEAFWNRTFIQLEMAARSVSNWSPDEVKQWLKSTGVVTLDMVEKELPGIDGKVIVELRSWISTANGTHYQNFCRDVFGIKDSKHLVVFSARLRIIQ